MSHFGQCDPEWRPLIGCPSSLALVKRLPPTPQSPGTYNIVPDLNKPCMQDMHCLLPHCVSFATINTPAQSDGHAGGWAMETACIAFCPVACERECHATETPMRSCNAERFTSNAAGSQRHLLTFVVTKESSRERTRVKGRTKEEKEGNGVLREDIVQR